MREVDACVHLASAVGVQLIVERPLEALLANVRGLDIVMAATARHGRRLLYSSTSEVYGKNTNGALSEDNDLLLGSPHKARWSYAIAKSFGEALAHGYHRDLGAEVVTVRLFDTVGPRQSAVYGMVLPRLVRQALAGDDFTVYGDGSQTRCFVHVQDTVEVIALLCDDPRAVGNVYNVGNTTQMDSSLPARVKWPSLPPKASRSRKSRRNCSCPPRRSRPISVASTSSSACAPNASCVGTRRSRGRPMELTRHDRRPLGGR